MSSKILLKYGYLAENSDGFFSPGVGYDTVSVMNEIPSSLEDSESTDTADDKNEEESDEDKKAPTSLAPTDFFSNLYGYVGFEGAQSSPMEYYSGSIADDPQITTNPWSQTYQSASRKERILVRIAVFSNFLNSNNHTFI